MLCVHIGPGPLGLGLIVEQLDEVGFEVCVVGPPHPAPEERRRFGIAFTDPEVGLEYRNVRWASNAAGVEQLPAEVLALLKASAPVLITCALGERIQDRADFVVDVVALRPEGAETVLLACENSPHEAYGWIAEGGGAALRVCGCVVDRICAWPASRSVDARGGVVLRSRPRDAQGCRIVRAHPVGEWLVRVDGPSEALRMLAGASRVSLVEGEWEGYEARKRWLVGGMHMVLALIARVAGVDTLPLEDPYEQDFLALAEPLMGAMAAGLARRWPVAKPSSEYRSDRVLAFTQSPDTTARILDRVLVRHDLRPLMGRVCERLGAPARAAFEAGEDCEIFFDAMALLVTVLVDNRLYYPDPYGWALHVEVDEEALEMFAQALEGWLERERAAALLEDLRDALGAQRALRSPPLV